MCISPPVSTAVVCGTKKFNPQQQQHPSRCAPHLLHHIIHAVCYAAWRPLLSAVKAGQCMTHGSTAALCSTNTFHTSASMHTRQRWHSCCAPQYGCSLQHQRDADQLVQCAALLRLHLVASIPLRAAFELLHSWQGSCIFAQLI